MVVACLLASNTLSWSFPRRAFGMIIHDPARAIEGDGHVELRQCCHE
jgi:hypothetical protein